jgi:hypothetical protein
MRSVLKNSDEDRLSILRATAIALGLPLCVFETIEGLDFPTGPNQEACASPAALVLVVRRRPRTTSASHAKPRLADESANQRKEGVHDG